MSGDSVVTEMELESTPDHRLLYEYGVDVDAGILYLGSGGGRDDSIDADEELAARAIKGIMHLDMHSEHEWITVILNNCGGLDEQGMAIYDALRTCRSPVRILVYGQCESIAVWILQAGDVRMLAPNAKLLIHDGEVSFAGSRASVYSEIEFDKAHTRRLNEILLQRIQERYPKYSLFRLERLLEKDVPLTPGEAIDLGLADGIIAFRPRRIPERKRKPVRKKK